MTTGIGLRDQRLRLYERRDSGANGFSRPVFVFTGEWWGRIDVLRASARELSGAYIRTERLVATFSDEVPVPQSGVLRHGDSIYYITDVQAQRLLRRIVVGLDAVVPEQVQALQMYDVPEASGTHVIDPF